LVSLFHDAVDAVGGGIPPERRRRTLSRVNSLGLNTVRYGIPAVLLIAGLVVWATGGTVGIAAGAMFVSAATAVLLLNVLHRIGVEGDKDRDREEAARRFFDEHGRWPDEPERRP
jgi:hypothetical protein